MLALGLTGCARASTTGPTGDPARDASEAESIVVLRYAVTPVELTQTTSFSVAQTGGGKFGRVSLDLTARLGWAPREDHLEVSWAVVAADNVEREGTLATEADDDPSAGLTTHGKGAYSVHRTGERDELASARLPENQAFRRALRDLRASDATQAARAQLLSLMPVALALPELPVAELAAGRRMTVEEAQELELEGDGLVMPAEVARSYTLLKLDEAGATPIAEVAIEVHSSGRAETPDGTLSIEGTAQGTLLFDVGRGLPVAFELARTETFDLGGQSGESTTIIQTTWED